MDHNSQDKRGSMPVTRRQSTKGPQQSPEREDSHMRHSSSRQVNIDVSYGSPSKADNLHEESKIIEEQLRNISDNLDIDDSTQDQLVKLKMNFTSLNDYLKNIIKVINQHAKLLNTLNNEMQMRTTEKQVGEMFQVISSGLPYEVLVKKIGGTAPPRRGSVLKLLGDASAIQPVHARSLSSEDPNQLYGQQQVLEGTEKFLKTTEMIGKYLLDLKEYQHSTDCQISRIDKEFQQRVTKIEFNGTLKAKSKKLKNKIRDQLIGMENYQNKLSEKVEDNYENLNKKIADLEQNTLWKINDYEKLLQTRVNETYMKDYVKGELNKLQKDIKDTLDRHLFPLDKKNEQMTQQMNQFKDRMGSQIDDLFKESENVTNQFQEERKIHQNNLIETKGELEKRLEDLTKEDDLLKDKLNKMTQKMKDMEKERQQLVDNLKKGMFGGIGGGGGGVDSQQYDLMRSENEAMEKKIKKLMKNIKEIKEKYDTKIMKLETELSKKAEKEAMIENQQKFFDNLHKMENETDDNITQMVGEELKKLGDQLNTQSKIIDKKMAKLQSEIDIEKINKQVDKKLNKDEARNLLDNQDSKLLQLDKQLKHLKAEFIRLETLVENLALAIKNIEVNGQNSGPANTNQFLIRQQTMNQERGVNCLSCGQHESQLRTPPRQRSNEYASQSGYTETQVRAVEYVHSPPPADRNPVQIISQLSHHEEKKASNLSSSNSQVIQNPVRNQLRPLSSNVRQGSQAYQPNTRQFPTYYNQKSKSNNLSFGGASQGMPQQQMNQSYTSSYYSNTQQRNAPTNINRNSTAGPMRGGHLKKVLGIKNDLQSSVQSRPKSKGGIGLIDDPQVERVFRPVD